MALGRLDRAWIAVDAAMPSGWHLDSLRCASTGLAPEQRSERWLAVAVGPGGEQRQAEDDTPERALNELARELRERRGSVSG